MPTADPARMSRRTALAWGVAATSAGCSRAGFLAVNVPAVFGAYERHTDIAYGDAPQQRLDVYVPTGAGHAPRAVVVFWHGGRWTIRPGS